MTECLFSMFDNPSSIPAQEGEREGEEKRRKEGEETTKPLLLDFSDL